MNSTSPVIGTIRRSKTVQFSPLTWWPEIAGVMLLLIAALETVSRLP